MTKAVDPTRPVLESSGWSHTLTHPEVRDTHDYEGNPATLRQRYVDFFSGKGAALTLPARYGSRSESKEDLGVPFMISEFGGIGWATEGGWGYGAGPKTLEEFYTRYQGQVDAQLDNANLFGFCYTQLTDVEQEHNGLYYYDRRPKFDVKKLHDITARQAAVERGAPLAPQPAFQPQTNWKVLVGAAQDGKLSTPYRYSTNTPAGEWTSVGFDDQSWETGLAPFGHNERRQLKTSWTTGDIYLRKTFEFDGAALKTAAVVISHDKDAEVFVNGQQILSVQGHVGNYEIHSVTEALQKALHKGSNTLAIHTHHTSGNQHIDLAVLVE